MQILENMTLTDQLSVAQKSLESACSIVLEVWNPGGAEDLADRLILVTWN